VKNDVVAYDFDSDGNDVFVCVAGRRIARRISARWIVIADGWEVTGDLNRPLIRAPLADGL
jgi:hypothetical protein